jgi:hypothetical protein
MSAAPIDVKALILRSLLGATVHKLDHPSEGMWTFDFGTAGLTVNCPWRILSEGAIVLGESDHGQKFGLPAPVDVSSQTLRIMTNRKIEDIEISEHTGDLCIKFSSNTQIDVFNDSSGYEGWNYADRDGVQVIGMGGGGLSIWDTRGVRTS